MKHVVWLGAFWVVLVGCGETERTGPTPPVPSNDGGSSDPPDATASADASTPTPDAGTAEGVPADMVDLLAAMNAARADTGSAPMTWNADVAANAAAWAAQCIWEHSSRDQRQIAGVQLGENISATTSGRESPASMGQGWIDEIVDYDCAANTCAPGQVCGHYTQIIWRSSTEVGCAVVNCSTGSPFSIGGGNWRYLVCQHMPAGNFVGRRPIPTEDCP